MAPRGAWVREKRRPKPAQVDPTVALLPMLNYLGCRPNNPAPRRDKMEHQDSPDFEEIEIVTPPQKHNHHLDPQQQDDHHHVSNQHQHPYPQQHQTHQQFRPPSREMPHISPARAAKQRITTATHETLTRVPYQAHARASPYSHSSVGARSYAREAHMAAAARASPHMSRAMAVNLNAITPLAM